MKASELNITKVVCAYCRIPRTSIILNIAGILVYVLSFTNVHAEITEGGRGMLFGDDHVFTVTAIKGWVLDNQSAVKQGLHMVFYPKGGSWSNSPVIIYGRVAPQNEVPSIKSQVERTVHDFHRNGSPNYKSEEKNHLTLSSGGNAQIYYYSGDQWGNYEAAAYIQESDTINYLVFNSRTKEAFDKYIGDFLKIARSYQNLYTSPSEFSVNKLNSLKEESKVILTKAGGKEYESTAVKAVGQEIANAMRDCTSYFRDQTLPAFTYLVRINERGMIVESYVDPTNGLSACFKGLMSNARYPAHSLKSFVLHINMKITP